MTRKVYMPRPYQKDITEGIINLPRCNVFAGMGAGKTVAVMTAVDILNLLGLLTKPVLVLAPIRVATGVWPVEALKWEHLRDFTVSPVVGTPKQREAALNQRAMLYTINYDNIEWLIDYHLTRGLTWPFGMVVADESTRLKGFRLRQGGTRARALGRVAHIKTITRWVNLTGTPASNGLKDLWGQTWFIDRGNVWGAPSRLLLNVGSQPIIVALDLSRHRTPRIKLRKRSEMSAFPLTQRFFLAPKNRLFIIFTLICRPMPVKNIGKWKRKCISKSRMRGWKPLTLRVRP